MKKTSGLFSTNNLSGRAFKVMPMSFDEFFNLFEGQTLECHGYKYPYNSLTFVNKDPESEFYINEEGNAYTLSTNLYISFKTTSKNYTYIIIDDTIYKCSKEFTQTVLPPVTKILRSQERKYH
ncbi:hypothetical protein SDC9_203422 [bioreactor metagenome]|uniref:Helicase SWF/SNF/SWI type bacterial domain-containing protein n=1 Tax=bioreactor metagenome TaxID=1076179 RepID=A0A645IWF3_9ZZZZ